MMVGGTGFEPVANGLSIHYSDRTELPALTYITIDIRGLVLANLTTLRFLPFLRF